MKFSVKLLFLFLLNIIFFNQVIRAQKAAISWKLNSNGEVSAIKGPVIGDEEKLSGMFVHDYSFVEGGTGENCQRTTVIGEYWPEETKQNSQRYIQFSFSVKPGITFKIDTISMYYAGMGGHNMKINISWSTNSSFATSTQLNSVPIAISDNSPTLSFLVFEPNTVINYGEKLYLRIYPWYTLYLTTKYVCLQNVVISGTTSGKVIPVLPIVSTSQITEISTTSAVCGGNVSFDGDVEVTDRGVCWNIEGAPIINDSRTLSGSGLGEFTSKITGLKKSTKYFVRAYAVNSVGISYGKEDSLVTRSDISAPVENTNDTVKVIGTSASLRGSIIDWGGSDIIEKGICYNTSGNPDINNEKIIDSSKSNDYTITLFRLKNETIYYARAFAKNALGIGYGEVKEFKILFTLKGAYADGIHKDTKVIQRAIDSCSNIGGGEVELLNGIYYTAPFEMKSNVTLRVDSTAIISASEDRVDFYPAGFDTSVEKVPSSVKNFITSNYTDNIVITGDGTIDGNGKPWWDDYNAGAITARPRLIQLNHSNHILLENITLKNSPQFHFVPAWCIDVTVNKVTILAPGDSPNTDGIDPATSHKVRITGCYIDTGDDNVAIKSGNNDPSYPNAGSSDIIISDCTFLHGHGVSIGSETNGGVDSMIVENCTFNGTDNGIRIKSNRTRGGNVRGITYRNLTMNKVKYPILFSEYYPDIPDQNDPAQAITNKTPYYHDITVENLKAVNCTYGGIIIGLPETPLTNIQLKNVSISANTGLRIRNAALSLDSVSVKAASGSSYIVEINGILTGVKETGNEITALKFMLSQNYPNPFNPGTIIKYSVPYETKIELKIYDMLGRLAAVLVNERKQPGEYEAEFNANGLSSGIYFYQIRGGDFVETKKMLLVK